MRGIRGEPAGVWLRDGRPARFVWRGRMYTVMFVLGRQQLPGAAPADPAEAAEPTDQGVAPGVAPADPGTGGRECWRVEATPERTVPPTRFELCHDLTADSWSLTRG
jgi:hypothetical protein